jgi:poly(3-hydroxybutyrate) depolymerase
MTRPARTLPAGMLAVALAGLAPAPLPAFDVLPPVGPARIEATLGPTRLDIFTYRPEHCARPSALLVFHGTGRTAAAYRDRARVPAATLCLSVYSPLFDRDRFPNAAYHRGGLLGPSGLRDNDDWTIGAVHDLVDLVRLREGAGTPVYLFGHSAGAQFLSRYAAYGRPGGVARIVLANPATYVMPTVEWPVPYGFGGLPGDPEAALQAYLGAPITVYLGQADTGAEDLTRNRWADAQGGTRLDRGRTVYRIAREAAAARGWPFGWRLVEVPGVGHSSRDMLAAGELAEALGLTQDARSP